MQVYSLSIILIFFAKNPIKSQTGGKMMRCTNLKCVIGIILFLFIGPFAIQAGAASQNGKPSTIKIDIHKGDTLYDFCIQCFGNYSNALIDQLMRLNPQISNPNLIYQGKTLIIPYQCNQAPLRTCFTALKKRFPAALSQSALKKRAVAAKKYPPVNYPSEPPQTIRYFKWIDDNTAIVKGRLTTAFDYRFFVDVPGDLTYEQANLKKENDGSFQITVFIGRKGRDYGQKFILKLVMYNDKNERINETSRIIIRRHHPDGEVVWNDTKKDRKGFTHGPTGWKGIRRWTNAQKADASQSDNSAFRLPGGTLVANYRYRAAKFDGKYLNGYGRTTLYGSSCWAKALLLRNKVSEAEQILRVWAAQIGSDGKIPRSANTVGDNHIDYDVRTGEIAHFLGAMAVSKLMSDTREWDGAMKTIVHQYLQPLINQKTGLVHGGYDAKGSNGYNTPYGYSKLKWCSAEHNFDVYQALILISHIFGGSQFGRDCHNMALTVANGINTYLWDATAGTFNRGWNAVSGADTAKALDCSAWGALFLLKQAILFHQQADSDAAERSVARAYNCLSYAAQHFQSTWRYKTPDGKTGNIQGYRPYIGKIDDLCWRRGKNSGSVIDWDSLNSMIWSEGSLSVAKAWQEFGRLTGSSKARSYSHWLHRQMLKLQSLSDLGGVLYSTVSIKGHFTMREDLASLSWLAYLTAPSSKTSKHKTITEWMPW